MSAVARSGKHTFREQLTPNADPAKTMKNKIVGARTSEDLEARLRQRLPGKIKARSVLCIEYMITASPEAFKRHGGTLDDMGNGYFNDALRWLRERHGTENVISSAVHLDETTPHLVAYVAPMTADNRLSCRDFLGGPQKMRQMQTDFYEKCGRKRGLQRGVKGSKAKHQDIKSFYAAMNEAGSAPKLKAKDYAAAALGIKTASWRKAEDLTKAQAQGAALAPMIRKNLMSRSKTTIKNADMLSGRLEIYEHKRLLLNQAEDELASRTQALTERERQINTAVDKIFALEAERDTLERRLDMLQGKGVKQRDQVSRKTFDHSAMPR